MAIPSSFGGSVFTVHCDPYGGMTESWFAARGDVMSWLHPEQHANYSGLYPAFSKECPEWMKQWEIVKIKTECCISVGEAKQLYEQQFQSSGAACSASSRLDGLALGLPMQRLLKPHVAYLRRPNSHGQLIAQHQLKL
jgi:hypothetical protein